MPDASDRLRGFGPQGLLAILVILAGLLVGPAVSAVLVLIWARQSRTPWRELGLSPPRSWAVTVLGGIAFGVAFKLVMKAVVMPLLSAPPINMRYHYLADNPSALPGMLVAILVGAGFGEEVFFRAYLFERLGKLLGRGRAALAVTILFTASIFAVVHYPDQGVPGVEQAAVVGLVFGGIFALRRELWELMIAHAAFDLTAVALIYWKWEAAVARALFE